jgi:hypothetical protein
MAQNLKLHLIKLISFFIMSKYKSNKIIKSLKNKEKESFIK